MAQERKSLIFNDLGKWSPFLQVVDYQALTHSCDWVSATEDFYIPLLLNINKGLL